MRPTLSSELKRRLSEVVGAIRRRRFELSPGGIFIPEGQLQVVGEYVHDVNGQDERVDRNIVVNEGILYMLDAAFHDATKVATWYMALFSGNVTPLATWAGANFASNATEITSTSEGYTETTRPVWNEAAAASNAITNNANRAAFTIATATNLNVYGAGMLSTNTRGDTAGKLASASKFASVRTLQNGDVFNLGYTLSLTSS